MVKPVFYILILRSLLGAFWTLTEICLIQINSSFITLVFWQHDSMHTEGQKVDVEAEFGIC